MLLTISMMGPGASDLGYLLHKHPDRFQTYDLSFGQARVFYTEVTAERCTACLMLDVDTVRVVRGRGQADGLLSQYVNDRAYAASSFLSVAIAQMYGSALRGQCRDRPGLAEDTREIEARLDVLPVRGGEPFLRSVFEPLGYTVHAVRHPLDEHFPEWGECAYYTVTVSKHTTLAKLLTQLYVLIPVFDNQKHYFVGEDELAKLLEKGSGWLAGHPEKEQIARRYLKFRPSLYREALSRLMEEETGSDKEPEPEADALVADAGELAIERSLSLHERRIEVVTGVLKQSGARRVLDLGCGEGKLLLALLNDGQFEEIVGMDVSFRTLETVRERLKLDRMASKRAERVTLLQGSLMYRDKRLDGYDAAAVVEVIEHLDPPRLEAFERVLFEFARPGTVVITTPNREYNVKWEAVGESRLRHGDHRFEWTRPEFAAWGRGVAERYGYSVRFLGVGDQDEVVGAATQMGVFERTVRQDRIGNGVACG